MSTADPDERAARVVLNAISEPGSIPMSEAVRGHGALEVLARLRSGTDRQGRDLAARLAAVDPGAILDRATREGLRFVVPGDREWPESLEDLANAPVLHRRGGVPLGLWVKGRLRLDSAVRRAVCVVGSRSATSYGCRNAGDLAAGLAEADWTVVSGAAIGIDHAAHRAALARRGTTVAVLACGADKAYPSEHARLLDYIADTGLVVSEAPIGGAPTRIRFLARNRLIAAFGRGTVVVEAAVRSGALNTASWADGLGRVVMGVPGPVNSEPSEGVHELIRVRNALLVTRSEEVIEAVSEVGVATLPDRRGPDTARDGLSDVQRQVLDAVPVLRGAGVDSIARTAGLQPEVARRCLDRLFGLGMVEAAGNRWRVARARG